jgi:hypothetical protein
MSAQAQATKPPSAATQPPSAAMAGDTAGSDTAVPRPADAIRDAFFRLGELRDFLLYYISAKVDAIKMTARRAAILAALGLIAAVSGATVIVVSVVLLLRGIANALGTLFPNYPWLGEIIVGVVFLAIPVISILIGMRVLTRTFKTLTVQKYESRQRQQREQYGHSVRDETA